MKFISFILIPIYLVCGCGGIGEQYLVRDSSEDVQTSVRISESANNTSAPTNNTSSVVGSWSLNSFTGNISQAIGSNLSFNNNGTFSVTQPNFHGTYSVQGNMVNFNFSDGTFVKMSYTISDSTLNLIGVNVSFNMVYTRS